MTSRRPRSVDVSVRRLSQSNKQSIALSPDDKTLAVADDRWVRLVDTSCVWSLLGTEKHSCQRIATERSVIGT